MEVRVDSAADEIWVNPEDIEAHTLLVAVVREHFLKQKNRGKGGMKASILLMSIGAMFGAPIALELIPQDKYPIAFYGCITVMVVLVLAGIFRYGTESFGPPDS